MLRSSCQLRQLRLIINNASDLVNGFSITNNSRHKNVFYGGFQQQQVRFKKDDANISALFKPVLVRSNPDDISVGTELTGKLDKGELLKVLNKFTQKRETKILCMENGLDC